MTIRRAILSLSLSAMLLTAPASAQSVNITRSILNDQPYTLIYPGAMLATGGAGSPLTNHPDAPLQCDLTVVPVDDTAWTPQSALETLDDDAVAANWTETFPGFTVSTKGIAAYQSGSALIYEGQSTGSPVGAPLTIVHTETVDNSMGYVLNCLFATAVATRARPLVDFIIANFSTHSDAECCVGATIKPDPSAPAAPLQ